MKRLLLVVWPGGHGAREAEANHKPFFASAKHWMSSLMFPPRAACARPAGHTGNSRPKIASQKLPPVHADIEIFAADISSNRLRWTVAAQLEHVLVVAAPKQLLGPRHANRIFSLPTENFAQPGHRNDHHRLAGLPIVGHGGDAVVLVHLRFAAGFGAGALPGGRNWR